MAPMIFNIMPATALELQPWRAAYRNEARCQIIHDGAIGGANADAFTICSDNRVLGYGAIWNKYYPSHLMEFFVAPEHRHLAQPMYKAFIAAARPTHLEAQTNMPLMHAMLLEFGQKITEESILFEDAHETFLSAPELIFRARNAHDEGHIFQHHREPVGDWVIESEGRVVATGGYYCHDNPPYGDIFMEVHEPYRKKGIGSFLVQELKRVARQAGKTPAARCDPDNTASYRTLQRAGFVPCGKMCSAKIRTDKTRG